MNIKTICLNKYVISICLALLMIMKPGQGQITGITFYPYKQFLLVGQTKEFIYELVPDHYSPSVIKWETSDSSVVVVDQEGFATGISPGWAYVYSLSKYSTAGDMCEVHVRDDNTSMKLEAEDAVLTSPLEIIDDVTASGGKCIIYQSGDHSQTEVPDSGHAAFTINLEEEGLYSLFINIQAADINNNSFYYKVDTLDWRVISTPDTIWKEETKNFSHIFTGITEYPFLQGEHTIEFAYRQPGVKLDYIRLIRDSSSVHRYESHYSDVFGKRRWINIMLPSYYDKTDKRFPLITFSHGWGGRVFRQDQGMSPHLDFNRIQERLDEDSVIFVMTDGKVNWFDDGEMSNYSPYNMIPIFDLYYEDYFLELFDYLDANYRTIPDPRKRSVMGHSMGGGIVLRLGQRHPDKVAAVQPTCAGVNHLLGVPGRNIRWHTHEFAKNFHGTHVRLHETTGDYLNQLNKILYAAMEREQLEHIQWSEIEGHHTVDIAGRTVGFDACFDFMLEAMNDPLPKPERWHFAEFRPDFQVWDYSVTSDLERIGFLDFTGVTKGGMKIFARKWMPDGPALPGVTINVTTAPLYKVNASYNMLIYDITEESSVTETVMSDAEGRISFSVTGNGQQIGIYDNDTPPEIVILSHTIDDSTKFLSQGREGMLKIQLLNRGGNRAENVVVELTTDKGSVSLTGNTLAIPAIDAGATVWLDETVSITAGYDTPAYKEPIELRLNAVISDDHNRQWKDELYVPVLFNVPAFSNYIINDNIPEGAQNNVNGFAEPGELVVLETSLQEKLRLQYDDEYILFTDEEAVYPDNTLSYSVIKISEDAPVGHQVTFQARYEYYDYSIDVTNYRWGTVSLEITDNTSGNHELLERDSSQTHLVVFPNPVSEGQFTLEFSSGIPAGELSLIIRDINGRNVFSTSVFYKHGNQRYVITPGASLPPGMYIISLESDRVVSKTKLVVR